MYLTHFHPYWQIVEIVKSSDIATLNFSYYQYLPQSIVDERTYFSLSRKEFLSKENMEDVFVRCPRGSDLALHSNVLTHRGETLHIPMVDMSTRARAHIQRLSSYLGIDFFNTFSWYDSGRSYHGYSSRLIDQNDWVKMMGLLLLSNQKNLAPLADPRWIGHRLLAGYAALRWTRNTDHYISGPQRIELKQG